ncbi:uncharacterized protein [Thunnus thynnus]|uniref:uncharacterized protein n=1 Tax=Thunnus thynnus TaxID=8237 RepID=UPI0035294AD4
MDLRTVVTISTLLLMTVDQTDSTTTMAPANNTTNNTTNNSNSNSNSSNCNCHSTTAHPNTRSSTFALGYITIKWIKTCQGEVHMILNNASNSSLPFCNSRKTNVQSLLSNVCESKKGCENVLRWEESRNTLGYNITESGQMKKNVCKTLRVQCKVEVVPDVQGQLQGYKVVTALLCCVLMVLLLMRFTRPTIKALQRRLSDRRQNRWIGPTQSHSVSYHRGKTAVKNNDGEKRLSYPALERLTVSDSREPSSNRNSGYNF